MIVQFRNEKVSNHGFVPITIDCNVVAFIVFEEGFHQPIKRTKQLPQLPLAWGSHQYMPCFFYIAICKVHNCSDGRGTLVLWARTCGRRVITLSSSAKEELWCRRTDTRKTFRGSKSSCLCNVEVQNEGLTPVASSSLSKLRDPFLTLRKTGTQN
ncbi:hypothetical protein TNCV_4210911 [Trichonephila clavipes]|nr:hypothetical protein TNCV_4210911 [Trichonephila clavipes]